MASNEDLLMSPIKLVDELLATNPMQNSTVSWVTLVADMFQDKLTPEVWNQVPSLNDNSKHSFVDGQLVRFRGMIQDKLGQELYLLEFAHRNPMTGVVKITTCRYRENLCNDDEVVTHPSTRNWKSQRGVYLCVDIPGESDWVSEGFKKLSPQIDSTTTSAISTEAGNVENMDSSEASVGASSYQEKNATRENEASASQTSSANLTSVQSIIVKINDDISCQYNLNDALEFVGVISMEPRTGEGLPRVPILYVVHTCKITTGNPLLPFGHQIGYLDVDILSVRNELQSYLNNLLFGDSLAVEYMICHLISKVYMRREVTCIGKLSINLFNVPLEKDYPKQFCQAIQSLLCRSRYIELTVDNLNNLTFVPKKNRQSRRLETGLLQLSPYTHLILNETLLQKNVQLEPAGVENAIALGKIISWQRIPYNWDHYNIEIDYNVPCMVISKDRSTLPSDRQVLLQPKHTDVEKAFSHQLSPESLNRIRVLISLFRHCSAFHLRNEMRQYIEDDYVKERNDPQNNIGCDDLIHLLVLARLLAISRGEFTVTEQIWTDTKKMEKERKARIAHLPQRLGAN